jgi:siderophore synthetase component
MISEFMYEEIIHPEIIEEKDKCTVYQLVLEGESGQEVSYQFEGKKRLMDSYRIYPEHLINILKC